MQPAKLFSVLAAIKQSDISLHPASLTWLGNHCNPGPWQSLAVPGSVKMEKCNLSTKTQEIDVEVKEWTTPGQAGVLFRQIIKCEMIKIQTLPKSRPQ